MSNVFGRPVGSSLLDAISGPQLQVREADFKNGISEIPTSQYDAPGSPLRSTQQIPLDWSQFENHTFFSSAEVNVNIAFDTIINGFPFDGTQGEILEFLDSLTGFERHVFERFPKSLNSLKFENNSHIVVNDRAGSLLPELSKRKDGSPVLDPGPGSISFQMKLFIPDVANDNQIIVQRLAGDSGYTLYVSESSTDIADVVFQVSSGSTSLITSSSFEKGKWFDLAAQFNRRPASNRLQLFIDGNQVSISDTASEFSSFDTTNAFLTIGAGVQHNTDLFLFDPVHTLSGAIDDLRVYHSSRTAEQIKNDLRFSAYPNPSLKLYFKFNEPQGPYSQSSLLLDSSGNGLHSYVQNYDEVLRDGELGRADFIERLNENPTLFPDFSNLVSLNQELLASASAYDETNPNLITKLVPKQYFESGQLFEDLETEDGTITQQYPESGDKPRDSRLGSAQLLSSLLFIWAKQFDENKLFVDHFSNFENLSIVSTGSIANTFIIDQARSYGFDLPRLFTPTTLATSDFGDDVGISPGEGINRLMDVQYDIWRRLISNIPKIVRSKGTISSVKDIIRAYGVNPDTALRIREYGGSRSGFITGRRYRRSNIEKVRKNNDDWTITTSFLSASRIEPGLPLIAGSMTPEGSDDSADGLLTSGSWTVESLLKVPGVTVDNAEPMSLVRLFATGSNEKSLILNVVAEPVPNNYNGLVDLKLYGAYDTSSSNSFAITLTGSHIFDGDSWHVSFGREKKSEEKSKWFLRAAKQVDGDLTDLHENTAIITSGEATDIFSNVTTAFNASGSFLELGFNPNPETTSPLLNEVDQPGSTIGRFLGEATSIRFYSIAVDADTWKEHVRNPESLGVNDPIVNFGFNTTASGSWQRLRTDISFQQEQKSADAFGNLTFVDLSQNNLDAFGTGFEPFEDVILFDDVIFSSLEPKFDERSEDKKVRVRSWQNFENVEKHGGQIGPVYEVPRFEEGEDDNRFGIEISVVRALDEDIIRIFSGYEFLDNAIGAPSLMFDDSYPTLESLREVYFNRLTDKIEIRNVFLFTKWFEENIGKIIEQVIPSNTRFFGTNFVIESHILERSRSKYYWGDMYLDEDERVGFNSILELETSTGS